MGASAEPAELLERAALFAGLSSRQRAALARTARVARLAAGEILWRAGDPPRHLGLVAAGRLKLRRSEGRHEVIVDVAVPGDLVGDVAFTLGTAHPVDAVSLRPSRVLLIPAEAARGAVSGTPRALAALAQELAGRAQRLQDRAVSLSAGSVERRLASVLSTLADRAGEPFPGGVLIPMRLRRADLAALAATTAESVSRRISAWRAAGLLVRQPAGYLIRDVAALRRAAGDSGP